MTGVAIKLVELKLFFYSELENIYPEGEINAMFNLICEHYFKITPYQINSLSENEFLNPKFFECIEKLKQHIPLQYIWEKHFFTD